VIELHQLQCKAESLYFPKDVNPARGMRYFGWVFKAGGASIIGPIPVPEDALDTVATAGGVAKQAMSAPVRKKP
jgi:hypothetical protein